MTLPNWVIRCLVVLLTPMMVVVAVVGGAWHYIVDYAWPEIREAWREPEYTRWGNKRHDR